MLKRKMVIIGFTVEVEILSLIKVRMVRKMYVSWYKVELIWMI